MRKHLFFLLYILLLSCPTHGNINLSDRGTFVEGYFVQWGTPAHEAIKSLRNHTDSHIVPCNTRKRHFPEVTDGQKEEKREDEIASPIENLKNGGFITAFFYASLRESLLQHIELLLLNHDFHPASYRKHILLRIFRL